ncbi:hypothetical protein JOC95_002622 [Bacillus tianshenii]|uniref:Uncharacterized protein n=1 Tax=Sutcliffiella tianshenii TaxID=1463404 RepID=A0ABS2P1E8_9BACI|nr:hypothetical protein [Bacillus tianshenii]MBM7620767.1 hypothetical protein [Bacillus tianshenii]MCA1321295.1 hypothetical protein [Bacillus tianshenii]
MAGITFGLFTISILLLLGGMNYFLASQRAGVYPPKRVLQQKGLVICGGGGAVFLLALLALWIS